MSDARDAGNPGSTVPTDSIATPATPVWPLHQQRAALELDQALELSDVQAQALLPLLEETRSEVAALQDRRAAAEPVLAAALTQALDELIVRGSVADATHAVILEATGGFPGALHRRLRFFWRAAQQVLSDEQLLALRSRQDRASSSEGSLAPRWSGVAREPRLEGWRTLRTLVSDPFLFLVKWRAGWHLLPTARA